ncbi:MAG: hypothetical protein FWC62_02975 [Firmicutes bacterium]|nr:hypothetical protein [Bacillota bacterium]
MDYHAVYLKMFNASEDTIRVLENTIKSLALLREKIITIQREAEDMIINSDDELEQTE